MAPKTPKRPRGLSASDRALWDHVARSIDPLATNRVTEKAAKSTSMVPDKAAPPTKMVPRGPARASARPPSLSAEDLARAMAEPPEAAFSDSREGAASSPSSRRNVPGLDKRSAERLRKGQMQIDARLDLHGLTRNDAHRRLRSFITVSQMQGMRCVLVITGKGSTRAKSDDAPFMKTERSGILREAVPKWLTQPDLRHLVIDIRAAQPKHGGSGALYVLLRRRRSD